MRIPMSINESLHEAYELWLDAEHPKKPATLNRDRSQPDLLNYKRAVQCFAVGVSNGTKDMRQVELSALEISESLAARHVVEGVHILANQGKGKEPAKKTVSNLISCLKSVRAVVLKQRNVPLEGKDVITLLRERPKRPISAPFPTALWPERLQREWCGYRTWKTKLFLTASEGAEYRRRICRPSTIDDTHVLNVNRYVGFLVRECDMTNFGLAEICDPELFTHYLSKTLSRSEGRGYTGARTTAATLATISQYLVAKGELPPTKDGKAPWSLFYDLGREAMQLGARNGAIVAAADMGDWKPSDLSRLGLQAWNTEPARTRAVNDEYLHALKTFQRKRSAMFFFLAPESPVRSRNWLEMRWGKNLSKTKAWVYKVRFVGDELKIAQRGYVSNVYEIVYSKEASCMIDRWQEYVITRFGPNYEEVTPYVFPPFDFSKRKRGRQLSYDAFAIGIKALVMEFRGETFNPHKIRHIVGSFLVNEYGLGGVGLAAKLLGDTPKVVMDTYYRPGTQQDMKDYVKRIR
jgi:hypothetical protein